MSTHPDVRVGQVWADNDARGYGGRKVRVVALEVRDHWRRIVDGSDLPPTHARCVTLHMNGADKARHTSIRLSRFRPTSTGYRLVSQPEGDA